MTQLFCSFSFYVELHFFFCNCSQHTVIYTLSLHDALPISARRPLDRGNSRTALDGGRVDRRDAKWGRGDRKSTRLNSSHVAISYAVFCLKKKILVIIFYVK